MYQLLVLVTRLHLQILHFIALLVSLVINALPHTGMRWVVRVNLLLAYPNLSTENRLVLEKKIIRNQCLSIVESVKSWGMPPAWSVAQITYVEGFEFLQAALKNPRGMLAIVPHIGTWEMMNAWVNQYGSPTIMYKPNKESVSDQFMLQGRQRLSATLVPTDANGVKAIFKTLKNGGFSIVLPDHVPHDQGGVYAPFFGISTFTGTLVSKLAHKTRCELIGLVCIRREYGKGFAVRCVRLDAPELYDMDITIATTALNIAVQQLVEPITEHYMWGYKRFKKSVCFDGIYQQSELQVQRIGVLLTKPSTLSQGFRSATTKLEE